MYVSTSHHPTSTSEPPRTGPYEGPYRRHHHQSGKGETAMTSDAVTYKCHRYGDHSLQRVGVWQFSEEHSPPPSSSSSSNSSPLWIVYIHGGAWRDPEITHTSFNATIDSLTSSTTTTTSSSSSASSTVNTSPSPSSPPLRPGIAGFASIDYRLSPHPDYPQDPSSTPVNELRSARHPDHLRDVQSGLTLLSREYNLQDDRYILVGHSAGATLSFQTLTTSSHDGGDRGSPLPAAVVGVAGIYDLRGIDERHGGGYAGFISGAFGDDAREWDAASPARFEGDYGALLGRKDEGGGPAQRKIFLVRSVEDELVDSAELQGMKSRLERDGVKVKAVDDLTGHHDDVWRGGDQMARIIGLVLESL
ncbi:N-formyl-L-kynurenine hydrolase [Geosmithia morbida]|uniref:Kynurenine formamidase n=1 Tax=Geosmithia morbida TaxID=1094350 RepID=A0A9P5D0M4_9HYPO|nr:N-formyl-L-kynurenine hydrolase [Geosmithia morbida]KAF4119596.1 N-formyl-L-kynurenine hydrolase [Geosmithia morbida]